MSTRHNVARCLVSGAVILAVGFSGVAVSGAAPTPPPNPSDSDVNSTRADAAAKAGKVGELANQLVQAEGRLQELASDVELKMEDANKARVDLQVAQDAASRAEDDSAAAKAEAGAAGKSVEDVRKSLDAFASSSYQQGSVAGSITAFLGAQSPDEVLQRAQLLDAVSGSQLNALEQMQRARTEKANKDSLARKALAIAQDREDAATAAKRTADSATATAVSAQAAQSAQAHQFQTAKAEVEKQLTDAQVKASDLQSQRQRYQDWLAAKQGENEDAARRAAEAAGDDTYPSKPARPSGGSVQTVINRAIAQLGVTYAWGGGTATGPSQGIRDGGVADAFGDYHKVGFDCSGLMIYAFAGVGVSLPHYSGYQYTAGRRVPLSQMQPGDMLFWGTSGRIHHVALYIGNGKMVEAPFSGSQVRVASVRYGGIMPFATRVF